MQDKSLTELFEEIIKVEIEIVPTELNSSPIYFFCGGNFYVYKKWLGISIENYRLKVKEIKEGEVGLFKEQIGKLREIEAGDDFWYLARLKLEVFGDSNQFYKSITNDPIISRCLKYRRERLESLLRKMEDVYIALEFDTADTITPKGFNGSIYNGINSDKLEDLAIWLVDNKYIEGASKTNFIKLFSNKEINYVIDFLKPKNRLSYLLRKLSPTYFKTQKGRYQKAANFFTVKGKKVLAKNLVDKDTPANTQDLDRIISRVTPN